VTKIGICGYGNLGRGVEAAVLKNPDMELVAVFTRRQPVSALKIKANVPVVHVDDAPQWQGKIDVMIMCGGSANDLPVQGPAMARMFNTVDSYDTHAKIPEYFAAVDLHARENNRVSIVSIGWDPGLFSLMRLYMGAVAPCGQTYTFWGPGVSQGHSDAIRGVQGVQGATQYTIPVESAVERIRNGENPELTARQKHTRLCYVVAESGADKTRIEKEIVEMPNYFSDYDTTVHFITQEELQANHGTLPHGGKVIHMGETSADNKQMIEFSIKLGSNPEFTSSILLAYARAAHRLALKGECGARTILDVPPALLAANETWSLL